MRTTGQAILENLGYEVTLAENGRHGLDIFEKDPDVFDLVILDMIMPEMNGRACFVAMRNVKHDVKIILSSGFSREEDIQEMKDAGLSGFIRKPFRSSTLSQVVKSVIDKSI
jgi:CheY-like chemotaxis protein